MTYSLNIVSNWCASLIAIVVKGLNQYKYLSSGSCADNGKTVRTEHQTTALRSVVHPVKYMSPWVLIPNETKGRSRPQQDD
jgi:hypothetical protein